MNRLLGYDDSVLCFTGEVGGAHIIGSLVHAAQLSGIDHAVVSTAPAYEGSRLTQKALWLWDKRPQGLARVGRNLLERVAELRKTGKRVILVTAGMAPVGADTLRRLGEMGVVRVNYSTDDPWSTPHRSRWHLEALSAYDRICTTRTVNIAQFRDLGVADVCWVPFGYDERHSCSDAAELPASAEQESGDVLLVGGADQDRIRCILPLIEAGIPLRIYGSYWDGWSVARPFWQGVASPERLRDETRRASVSLVLNRFSNRDQHTMRSFEAAAAGGFLVLQDTAEHRRILEGAEEGVLYYETCGDMVDVIGRALGLPFEQRSRKRHTVRTHIVSGENSYRSRLSEILPMIS